jgi:hypothetical protein
MEPTVGPIPIPNAVSGWRIATQVSGRRPIFDALPLMSLTRIREIHDAQAALVTNDFGPQRGSLV